MRFRSVMLFAALAPLIMAGAPQPVRLQPSSPWDVDYAENSCRLIRIFGEGKTLTKFELESPAPGDMDMLVFGRALSTNLDKVTAKFLPIGSKPFDGSVATTVGTGETAILWSAIPMWPTDALQKIERERAARKRDPGVRPPGVSLAEQAARRAFRQRFATAVTEIEIDSRPNHTVILETGSLGDAIAAFDKCVRDSLKDWGVDPDLEDKIVRPVWAVNPSQWLSSFDYPEEMLAQREESEVAVRLLVDASGKITKCTCLSHFDEPEFNRITCDLIQKRAVLKPAELADGTKVPSYYTQRVVFRVGL